MTDIVERLRAEAFDAVNWDGETMKQWDKIRKQAETLPGSDLSRLMFQGLIESLAELMVESACEIECLRNAAQTVTGHPRHNVYFMCQCCEEENPENAVCCREDIAVMPDGTWLCDNCYSDCEKTAYGLVASDIEDFEFPQFEDLPRPAPYIDFALSSAERGA